MYGIILIGLGHFQFCFSQMWKNDIFTNSLCPGEEYWECEHKAIEIFQFLFLCIKAKFWQLFAGF